MIDLEWSRTIHSAACGLLAAVLLIQLAILTPVTLPWALGLVLVVLVVEGVLTNVAAPEVVLSPALWLSALATARPGHALFVVGAVILLRAWRSRARVVAVGVVAGLAVLTLTVPEALFSSWSATEVSHHVWLYRAVVLAAAAPVVLFALSRPEPPTDERRSP